MPYYIAALNIEHAYYERSGEYEAFNGMCFVDTLDMTEHHQYELGLTQENIERIQDENKAAITVVIGNPPYNVGQVNENDNNKNRKYKKLEEKIRDSYAKDSRATNKNALSDAYVKFFRWATDRLGGRDGIVCFVSNNSFVENIAFDGMRRHLVGDFTRIYHVDLHGNVRKNPRLSGTTHNVFGIQVGVGITVAVRKKRHKAAALHYHRVPELWRKEEKLGFLHEDRDIEGIRWKRLKPSVDHTWLVPEEADRFAKFISLGGRESKAGKASGAACVFVKYGRGVATCRDAIVYDFDRSGLVPRVQQFIEDYNAEVDRYKRLRSKPGFEVKALKVDDFVKYDRVKWSESLKANLVRGKDAAFEETHVRESLYRPFCSQILYFDSLLNERRYQFPHFFPTPDTEHENRAICLSGLASEKDFFAYASQRIVNLSFVGFGTSLQCFPFYVYDEDGSNRRENITAWALNEFRKQFKNNKISKWDIFYYIYGLLHHPGYREKYADCLKCELPRIPYAPDFKAFCDAGRKLAKLHLEYEEIEPYKLKFEFNPERPASYVVEDKMRLSKDKKTLKVNDSLTLSGLPATAFKYRLGNRSALEWVIDQYRVKADQRSGIRSDPNRKDDPEYIVRLVGQVVRVSLETVEIVRGLPEDFGG